MRKSTIFIAFLKSFPLRVWLLGKPEWPVLLAENEPAPAITIVLVSAKRYEQMQIQSTH
jgi:hypothetical protein